VSSILNLARTILSKIANAISQTFPKSAQAAQEGGVGGEMPAPPELGENSRKINYSL